MYEYAFYSTTPATHLCTYTRQMATLAPSFVVFHAIFDVSTRLYLWFHQRPVPPVVMDLYSQCVKVFLLTQRRCKPFIYWRDWTEPFVLRSRSEDNRASVHSSTTA